MNLILLAVCAVAFLKLQSLYADFRHFRALPTGISEASSATNIEHPIVLFGDSRVETWSPLPSIDRKNIINAGVTGETTTEMRRRFDNDVLRLQPEAVVIQAGINDLTAIATRRIPDSQQLRQRMLDNLEYFVSTLTAIDTRVILTSIIPNKNLNLLRKMFWHPTLQQSVADTNTQLQLLAEKYQATWLDINPVFVDPNDSVRSEMYRDTLHVNLPAYMQVNELVEALFLSD